MVKSLYNPKAILIDGNSLAYRAFYALPDTMKNSEGIVTNAIYGFTSMILKLVEEKPDYIAVAFDRKEPTFRHIKYKEYKGTRDKAPPTLHPQFPYIKELVEDLNIPIYELVGFEADDLIGTLAKKAEKEGFEVEIVTGDSDALQLVTEKIKVMTTRKGISDIVIYDEKAVEERYGLKPNQLIDFKALKGDTSDNVPGMPGIGDKTAAELLKKYHTLDNLLAHAKDIEKPKLRETLLNEQEKAHLSKMLVTIITDVPLETDFTSTQTPDWEKVIKFFERMEFKTLINKYKEHQTPNLFDKVETKRKEISKFNFKLIDNDNHYQNLIHKLKECESFAFDTETDSLNTFKANLIGISFSIDESEAFYLPFGHKVEPASEPCLPVGTARGSKSINRGVQPQVNIKMALTALKPIFEDKTKLKIGHNLKYDVEVMKKYDIEVSSPYFDTMVAAYLIDPTIGRYSLKKVGAQYLGRTEMINFDELGSEGNFATVPIDVAKDYACSDADVTRGLKEVFEKTLKSENMEDVFNKIEMPLLDVLIKMEETGVFIDAKYLKKLSQEIELAMKDLERHIFAICGEVFNLNSPKQLAVVLFEKLKLPIIKKTKTGASTDAEVLEELSGQFEIAEKLLEYRGLNKLKSTYVDTLPELINKETGRVHANFNQTITATGRLSSSNPNMQNIPVKSELGKRVREAFVPQNKGYKIIAADYSQIELRVLAHLSQDEKFIEAFKLDEDIHTATAADIFNVPLDKVTKEMRSSAKTVNFGIIYGISGFGLAKSLKIKRTEAEQFIEKYFKRYPGIKAFIEKTIKDAKDTGFVTTMLGRKRPLPDINSPNQGMRGFAERTAINTPVQGTAADMIKLAMVNIHRKCQMSSVKCQMILQVHDELVFEVPNSEVDKVKKIIQDEMQNALKLSVPLKIDIGVGENWAEAK
ncbi:DNA polymerase I [Candidatus Saganbacteria bacterium]|nr:DNA polymerase I [Candidatus Saganbacteria bacterium]